MRSAVQICPCLPTFGFSVEWWLLLLGRDKQDFGVAESILLNGICCGLFDKVSEDIQDRVDYAFIITCTDFMNGNHASFNVRL